MNTPNSILKSRHLVSILAISAALAVTAAPTQAGQFLAPVGFDSDVNSGISSSNTYTVALDAGDSSGLTINGVTFTALTTSGGASASATVGGKTYTYSTTAGTLGNTTGHTASNFYTATGNVQTLLGDLVYASTLGTTTLTLPSASLTAGVTYDARVYFRPWSTNGTRNINLSFDEDGAGALGSSMAFNEDDPVALGFSSTLQAYYIDYRYTASGSNLTMVVDSLTTGNTFHFYGFTNEVAVPEPSTWAMILGGMGVMVFAQRARRRLNA